MTIPTPSGSSTRLFQSPRILHLFIGGHEWVANSGMLPAPFLSLSPAQSEERNATPVRRRICQQTVLLELLTNPKNSSPRALRTSNWLPSSRKRVGEPLAEDTGTAAPQSQNLQVALEPTTALADPEPEEDPQTFEEGLLVTKFSWVAYIFIC